VLGRDLKLTIEQEIRRLGLAIKAQAEIESPVGNPRLWRSNIGRFAKSGRKRRGVRYAPAGYTGGTFRKSWAYTWLKDRLQYIVSNPLPYASRLIFEGHSSQVPNPWWPAMIEKVITSVSGRPVGLPPQTVSGSSGSAAAFGGGA
jgi:hypothetical protein